MEHGRTRSGSGRGLGRWGALVWSVGFAVLTSVGLVVLTWALLVMDAVVAMALAVASPDAEVAVGGHYGRALALGVALNLVLAPVLSLALMRTPARTWPAWVQGLASAGMAAVSAGAVLLLVVGIDPVDFVLGL